MTLTSLAFFMGRVCAYMPYRSGVSCYVVVVLGLETGSTRDFLESDRACAFLIGRRRFPCLDLDVSEENLIVFKGRASFLLSSNRTRLSILPTHIYGRGTLVDQYAP